MLLGGNFPFFCLHYISASLPYAPPFWSLRAAKDVFGNTSSNTVIIVMETCYQMEGLTVTCRISSWVDYERTNAWPLPRPPQTEQSTAVLKWTQIHVQEEQFERSSQVDQGISHSISLLCPVPWGVTVHGTRGNSASCATTRIIHEFVCFLCAPWHLLLCLMLYLGLSTCPNSPNLSNTSGSPSDRREFGWDLDLWTYGTFLCSSNFWWF